MRIPTDRLPERHPIQFGVMLSMALSLPPVVLGLADMPGSLGREYLLGRVTAGILWAGSLAGVVGMLIPRRANGLAFEALGVIWTGTGLIAYGLALLTGSSVDNARIAAASCFGFGLFAFIRVWQITRYFRELGRTEHGGPS